MYQADSRWGGRDATSKCVDLQSFAASTSLGPASTKVERLAARAAAYEARAVAADHELGPAVRAGTV